MDRIPSPLELRLYAKEIGTKDPHKAFTRWREEEAMIKAYAEAEAAKPVRFEDWYRQRDRTRQLQEQAQQQAQQRQYQAEFEAWAKTAIPHYPNRTEDEIRKQLKPIDIEGKLPSTIVNAFEKYQTKHRYPGRRTRQECQNKASERLVLVDPGFLAAFINHHKAAGRARTRKSRRRSTKIIPLHARG